MDRHAWNERYSAEELIWRAEPNQFLVTEVSALPPGRALDLACGEGRNAVWLAKRGWTVTGVDFSDVGLKKAARMAAENGVEVEWVESDVLDYEPLPGGFDLVIVFYLHLPAEERRRVMKRAVAALAPGGTIVVVAHDITNLTEGWGGPQDPTVLCGPEDFASDLGELDVARAERVIRRVDTPEGEVEAIDLLVRASRPATSAG
jgi:SAM-dependent methyltransferase